LAPGLKDPLLADDVELFSCSVGVVVASPLLLLTSGLPPVVCGVPSRISVSALDVASVSTVFVPPAVGTGLVEVGDEVVVGVDVALVVVKVEEGDEEDCGRSLLCQLIWIIGAKRLKAVMAALASGIVWVAKSPILLTSQVAVCTVVDVATMVQVWPLMLAQPNPLSEVSQVRAGVQSTSKQLTLGSTPPPSPRPAA
jgi:hypothetical protein